MSPERVRPHRFLHAVANLVSAAALYAPEHPARRRAARAAHRELAGLLDRDPLVTFSFLEDEVVHGHQPLADLRGWPWCRRLADAGIQRLELARGTTAEELEAVIAEIAERLEGRETASGRHPHVRYGSLGLLGSSSGDPGGRGEAVSLTEESEAIRWINEEAAQGERVPTAEASAVVRGLSVAMHDARQLIAPLLAIKSTDQYTTAHCINVSILAMSLAEYLKFGDAEVRAIGEAALLHDIGKTRVPLELLNKPGILTDEERAVVERHPLEGARMLLRAEPRHALAAMVAHEHHMHWNDAGGYPGRRYPRRPHRFSRLVQVCDVYDALRTRRPFRAPLSSPAALHFLEARAGTEFDPELVTAFVDLMERWEPPTLAAPGEEPPAGAADPGAGTAEAGGSARAAFHPGRPPTSGRSEADMERRPLVG